MRRGGGAPFSPKRAQIMDDTGIHRDLSRGTLPRSFRDRPPSLAGLDIVWDHMKVAEYQDAWQAPNLGG